MCGASGASGNRRDRNGERERTLDRMHTLNTQLRDERRLLTKDEVAALLQLEDVDLQELVDTRQLTEIRVRGKGRFDSLDVYRLIDSYKRTQSRRSH
jgi:hypothetical protein